MLALFLTGVDLFLTGVDRPRDSGSARLCASASGLEVRFRAR